MLALQAEVARLKRDKGEADGMVHILKQKLGEADDDMFALRAHMMTIEAEIMYSSKKKEDALHKKMSSLEAELALRTEQLKNAERARVRAKREAEELQTKQLLEQKRLDAEKRLLETKKRKQHEFVVAASQSMVSRQSQARHPSIASQQSFVMSQRDGGVSFPPSPEAPETTCAGVQTELSSASDASGRSVESSALVKVREGVCGCVGVVTFVFLSLFQRFLSCVSLRKTASSSGC